MLFCGRLRFIKRGVAFSLMIHEQFDRFEDSVTFEERVHGMPPREQIAHLHDRLHILLAGLDTDAIDDLWAFMKATEEALSKTQLSDGDEEQRAQQVANYLWATLHWPTEDLEGYCEEVRMQVQELGISGALIYAQQATPQIL